MNIDKDISQHQVGEDAFQSLREIINELREKVRNIEQQTRKNFEETANSSGINRDNLLLAMMTHISSRLRKVEKRYKHRGMRRFCRGLRLLKVIHGEIIFRVIFRQIIINITIIENMFRVR